MNSETMRPDQPEACTLPVPYFNSDRQVEGILYLPTSVVAALPQCSPLQSTPRSSLRIPRSPGHLPSSTFHPLSVPGARQKGTTKHDKTRQPDRRKPAKPMILPFIILPFFSPVARIFAPFLHLFCTMKSITSGNVIMIEPVAWPPSLSIPFIRGLLPSWRVWRGFTPSQSSATRKI